ncbi:unnamed protein product [Hermetia illucens]|uniref:Protein arginine N-methyltransferase n=2 Tax=Hermetia illucens TaxID=343691 RepID=A0A7R8YSF3_HERIL|nr:unnamed protein product [Hermetia illucens]
MGTFVQNLNPITGRSEWEARCDDYDYHQEVARSAFADMLHDTERNKKYFAALQKTIKKLHENGIKANVLDIGTGTGLLSMMAVKSGADSVTTCEAFLPMANCAEKVIGANGMSEKIKLIKKRSTELKVGPGCDMEERANVLVTEVFDTELIGEGAIEIFNHAHRYLLTEDCVVIPSKATIYAQVVESPFVQSWNKPRLIANLDADILLKVPKEIQECEGECAVHDLQLSQIPRNQFNPLSNPLEAFEFNFTDPAGVPKKRRSAIPFKSNGMGVAQAVFFWWDIKMDQEGEIVLSCAPYWAHPDFESLLKSQKDGENIPKQNVIPWRDHWTQAIYYLPKPLTISSTSESCLVAYHDDYSFWFDARNSQESNITIPRLSCTCAFHLAYSRTRIGQLNYTPRTKKYMSLLEDIITPNSVVLSMSDGSLLGLCTRPLGASKVLCLEPNKLSRNVLESYVNANGLTNVTVLKSLDELENPLEITHVIGEPYFVTSILPWDNFYFGAALMKIREKLRQDVCIVPGKAKIYAIAVEFLDLFKIRAPLGECEGFKHDVFDSFVENSSLLADTNVEAQPLWEYPCKALSQKVDLLTVDFSSFHQSIDNSGTLHVEGSGTVNGIALWVDWSLDGSDKERRNVTTGPVLAPEIGNYISWDLYTRQGVHLLHTPKAVKGGEQISWDVKFIPNAGDIRFKFNLE